MALLSVKNRQKYLKALGFYGGEIDGIVGAKTKLAYRAIQERYFTRAADIDGVYGNDTDILLRNAYNVSVYCRDFKLEEFRCKCKDSCTGYPQIINSQLLINLQALRDRFGAVKVTSCLRCEAHNKAVGGASSSRHKSGKAADIKCAVTVSEAGRKSVMDYWKALSKSRYTYCNIGGNYPNMGSSVHCDVR